MKFALIFEAVDRASKVVRGIKSEVAAANGATTRGAETAARAARTSERAHKAAGTAAASSGKKTADAANGAARATRAAQKAVAEAHVAATAAEASATKATVKAAKTKIEKATKAVAKARKAAADVEVKAAARATKAARASARADRAAERAATSRAAVAIRAAERTARAEERAARVAERTAARSARLEEQKARSAERAARVTARAAAVEQRARAASERASARAAHALAREERSAARALRVRERYTRVLERGARRQLAGIGGGVDRVRSGSAGLRDASGRAGRLLAGTALGTGVVGAGVAMVMNQLVRPAAEFERYLGILETIEGTKEKAQNALGWVSTFAAKTPFELDAVTEAFVRMRSYGLSPMDGSLRTLGDTATAMGKPLMQAVEAIADAVTGENERLKEFGIRAAAAGKYFEYSFTAADGAQKTIRALRSDRRAIEKALLYIFDQRYAGAMERLSSTWNNMTTNMGDEWNRFANMVMAAGLFDWMRGRLAEILATLNRMAEDGSLQAWATEIATALQRTMEVGWEMAKGLAAAAVVIGGWAAWAAEQVGGWENLMLGLLALPIASVALSMAASLAVLGAGLVVVTKGLVGLGVVMARAGMFAGFSRALGALLLPLRLVAGAVRIAGAFVVGFVQGVVAETAALVAAAGGWRAALGLIGSRLAALATGGLRLVLAPLGLAARAFVALGAAILGTPVGWLLAGAAAIAGAAWLIYANWGSIGPWFTRQWETVKAAFSDAWEALTGFDWTALLPSLDWSGVVPELSWSNALAVLDWASWVSPLRWLDFVPGFSWAGIFEGVAAVNWADWIPSLDWSQLIPAVPTIDWSPLFAGLGGAFDGAMATASNAVQRLKGLFTWSDDPVAIAASDPASIERATRAADALAASLETVAGVDVSRPLGDLASVDAAAARSIAGLARLAEAARAGVAAARSVLKGASFRSEGVALMTTLAAGIRAGAASAVAAVRDVAQQMRDHLPHSPARVGPLSDLHRVRFAETLAGSIRAEPAIRAVRALAAGMVAALPAVLPAPAIGAPVSTGLRATAAPVSAGVPAASAGPISIRIEAPMTVHAVGDAGDFARQLREHADTIAAVVEEAVRRAARREY